MRHMILLILLLLTLPFLHAFTATIEPVKPFLKPGESASFLLHLQNTAGRNETYRIIFLEPDWLLMTDPITAYLNGITLAPGQQATIPFTLTPKRKLVPYVYILELRIAREGSDETQTFFIPVEVKSAHRNIGEFLIAVSRLVDVPREVDPRHPLTITVNLKNRNPKVIKDFTIRVDTPFGRNTTHTRLDGFEWKNVTITLPLPANATPGEYDVNVTLIADGEFLDPVIRDSFIIIPYTDVRIETNETWGFFRKRTSYTIINKGNAPAAVTLPMRIPFSWLGHFTSFRAENGTRLEKSLLVNTTGAYALTRITLPPGGRMRVEGQLSYALFVWLTLITILALVLYQVMRSPIQIRKDAVVVGVSQGGVSEIRIVLHVKNLNGKKRFKDITIIDPLPRLVELIREKDERFGKPRVYVNEREGSVIKWYIDSLEPYEERIITYRVRSRLSLLGKITLPRAILTFKDEDGTEQVTRSNLVRLDF